jgi:hypothetical protein
MGLPVSPNHLAAALQDGYCANDIALIHRHVGDLQLPTGQLVACDPFVFPEMEPFSLLLPRGTFPVVLSVARTATDQRVAFATLRAKQSVPITWKMMTLGQQDTSKLKDGELFGYPVDAGTGCFMDRSVGRILTQTMREKSDFYEVMIAEMERTYTHTWSWIDMKFGDGNLVAFSSGYGDGVYATYAGFDSDGDLCVVVTDFGVIPPDKPTL